jgi:uncharacterized cupin superfamily protein
MDIRNYLSANLLDETNCHGGNGTLQNISLFKDNYFATGLRFINYAVLLPNTTIGVHRHGNDEEVYVILEGSGVMFVDGETKDVKVGDVIVNKTYGVHGLENNSSKDLKILVFEVAI